MTSNDFERRRNGRLVSVVQLSGVFSRGTAVQLRLLDCYAVNFTFSICIILFTHGK